MNRKAVMISIQPTWCEKIFSGFKNLEFRKTVPNIELPFKCYVYCTQKKQRLLDIIKDGDDVYGDTYHGTPIFIKTDAGGGDTAAWINGWCKKVIGEMMVDKIEEITVRGVESSLPCSFYGDLPFMNHPLNLKSGGITLEEYLKYKGIGKVYGWHISDYRLFDKPKEISDFRYAERIDCLKVAPQSYVFVDELEEAWKEN